MRAGRLQLLLAIVLAICTVSCTAQSAYRSLDAAATLNEKLAKQGIDHYKERCGQIARECKEYPCAALAQCSRDARKLAAMAGAIDALIAEGMLWLADGKPDKASEALSRATQSLGRLQKHVFAVLEAYHD